MYLTTMVKNFLLTRAHEFTGNNGRLLLFTSLSMFKLEIVLLMLLVSLDNM